MNYVAYEVCPVRVVSSSKPSQVVRCSVLECNGFGIFRVLDASQVMCSSGMCREFVDSHYDLAFVMMLAEAMNEREPLDYGWYTHGC